MPSSLPSPQPGILDIAAYKPGDSSVACGVKPIKLSSNETPLGASPKAVAAYKAAAGSLERYPDGSATALRQAIAGHYGLNADRIVCGAGSDEILNLIAHAYLGPGLEGLFCEHGFLVYKIATQAHGGTPVIAPEKNLTSDVDALLARVSERTRVVFLANPNNPTGTYIPHDEVRRLRAGLRSDILLVLDAAYAEYVRRNDYEAGLELVATTENTVMTRTFSKIYGLAGLRIGWAYGPARCHRCAQPHPRPVQRLGAGDCRRRRRARRQAAFRREHLPQRPLARRTDRRPHRARPHGDAERRQLPADRLRQGAGQAPPPMPTLSCAAAASSSGGWRATACRRPCG